MQPHSEIGSGEARYALPQGRGKRADPLPSPTSLSEASVKLPQGHQQDSSLGDVCGNLMMAQRRRCFAITMQSRCDRATEAYIRVLLGYRTDMPEADRTKLSKLSRSIKSAIEDGEVIEGEHAAVAEIAREVVLCNGMGREGWDRLRVTTEMMMIKLAKTLPVWPFVESVKGVSALGLAVIVGEAGDLGGYPEKGHLWKRLGMAVLDGHRQGNPGTGASADDWISHGYNKKRRAQVWAFLDETMFRQQWAGDRDEDGRNPSKSKKPIATPAHPLGSYGAYYARKKAEYLAREWTAGHADKAARRYMSKMFLRDLWKAWPRAEWEFIGFAKAEYL